MPEPRPPRTADGDAFRFRAGRLSLDLCSTLLWRYRAPIEQLSVPHDLARWLREAGVQPVPRAVRDRDLHQARELREAIYGLVHDRLAGRALAKGRVSTINALAAHPDPAPRLTAAGEIGYRADEPAAAALSRIARDAIELLAGSAAARVRECAAPDCAFLFVDTSRAGRRRWCAMARCGNREHVRKHRRRLSDGGEVSPPSAVGRRRGLAVTPAQPSASSPVFGSCLCGGVRYRVTKPFRRANFCHCSRCRKHSGSNALAQGRVPADGFELLTGQELLRIYRPPDGMVKVFCVTCGSSVFGGTWPEGPEVSIRLGTLDDDPGIAPQFHTFTADAAGWDPLPPDGLPRHPQRSPQA